MNVIFVLQQLARWCHNVASHSSVKNKFQSRSKDNVTSLVGHKLHTTAGPSPYQIMKIMTINTTDMTQHEKFNVLAFRKSNYKMRIQRIFIH